MITDTAHSFRQHQLPPFFHHGTSELKGITFFHHHGEQPVVHHISLIDLEKDVPEQIIQTEKGYGDPFLSAGELLIYHDIKHPRRKRHWLGGRAALKHALLSLRGPADRLTEKDFAALSILPDQHGRPTLSGPLSPMPAISISHSGRYGIALAAASHTCGIDIQLVTERIFNVRERLMSREEGEILHHGPINGSEREKLTMLWAAKEAVKKGMLFDQPLIFTGITLRKIIPGKPVQMLFTCANPQHPEALVQVLSVNEYQLAFTLGGNDHA